MPAAALAAFFLSASAATAGDLFFPSCLRRGTLRFFLFLVVVFLPLTRRSRRSPSSSPPRFPGPWEAQALCHSFHGEQRFDTLPAVR